MSAKIDRRWPTPLGKWRNTLVERRNRRRDCSSTVVLYDFQSQKQDFIINTARKAITSLALSPDGRYLATGEVILLEGDERSSGFF